MSHWKNWAAITAEALAALAEGQGETAATRWLDARDAARRDGEMGNPCFAAAQANAAVGHVFLNQQSEAAIAFELAADAWGSVAERLSHEEIDLPKSSSSHHLRLATRHEAPFVAHVLRELEALCSTGAAIARTNARLLLPQPGEDPDTEAADHATIAAALGPKIIITRITRDEDLHAIRKEWQRAAARAARAAGFPAPSFQARLDLAVDVAVLLPRELQALQPTKTKAE